MKESIQNIIHDCHKGKRKAQMDLYKLCAQRLYSTCYRIIGNAEEAEEAMQDSILKILNVLSQEEIDIEYFEAWSKRIAVRTSIDYVRKQLPAMEELDSYSLMDEEEDSNEEDLKLSVEAIKKASSLLAPGYRLILSLYLFEGYDMEEIGEILHLKPSSIRSQYMRGKRKLIEILKEEKKNG